MNPYHLFFILLLLFTASCKPTRHSTAETINPYCKFVEWTDTASLEAKVLYDIPDRYWQLSRPHGTAILVRTSVGDTLRIIVTGFPGLGFEAGESISIKPQKQHIQYGTITDYTTDSTGKLTIAPEQKRLLNTIYGNIEKAGNTK